MAPFGRRRHMNLDEYASEKQALYADFARAVAVIVVRRPLLVPRSERESCGSFLRKRVRSPSVEARHIQALRRLAKKPSMLNEGAPAFAIRRRPPDIARFLRNMICWIWSEKSR